MDEVFDLIYKLEKKGNYEEALRHLEIAFEEKLGSFDIRSDMGRIYNKKREFEEALSCFDIVLPMDESNPEYLFGKGIALIGLNKLDDALCIFEKLTEIKKDYANGWYFRSVLSKLLGDSNAIKYFNSFLKYDNDEFRKTRSYYKFGIYFDEIEHIFRDLYRLDLLSEFKNELKSINLNPDQYTELIRLVPLDNLFVKIIELKKSKYQTDTVDIIRNEFKKQGLSDEDINDLFKIETIENLKKEVIELSEDNPFPDINEYSVFIPLKIASKYNAKSNVMLKHKDLLLFNRGNIFFDNKDFNEAIKCYDEGLEYNPDNLLLKFVKCCANYYLNGDSNV